MAHHDDIVFVEHADPVAEVGAFILGGVIGGAVAAVVMLLNAPRSGAETRRAIRERGLNIRTEAEQTAAAARTRIEGTTPDTIIADAKAEARGYRITNPTALTPGLKAK